MSFVHLHVHSHGSFLDAVATPKNIAKRASELGMSAVAITDHGNVFNAIDFYEQCQKESIKPILGAELNFVESCEASKAMREQNASHIVLLAENNTGWRNIIKLISASNTEEAFYYRPRIDLAMLRQHNEGVIALTACAGGVVSSYLRERRNEEGDIVDHKDIYGADAAVRMLAGIFDADHLFLEVQDVDTDYQRAINDELRKLALKHGLKTVATCNVHYISEDDVEAHQTLTSIGGGHIATSFGENSRDLFMKSEGELSDEIRRDEIEQTSLIAERCDVSIDLTKDRLPRYPYLPSGKTSMEYLRELVGNGARRLRLPEKSNANEYRARVNKELDDIEKLGFADYFLIVADVVRWAKEQGILVGPGRGSAGGSLVSYVLGITNIDPLEYDLIWERFLNVGRKSLPDIDTDIPRSKRSIVIDYIRRRFGEGNVAQLATFNKLAARAVLKDVFKVFGMDFSEANAITKLLPQFDEDHVPITLPKAIDMVPALQEYEDRYKPWFKIARSLEGCYKSLGTHAAAVVIADHPFIDGEYPLCRSADSKSMVFSWDMDVVDKLHLLKLDILGLSTLDVIQDTFDLIKEHRDEIVSLDTIILDDDKTFDLLSDGKTVGVFQLEKQLGKIWSKMLQPRSVKEIAAVISAIRPGAIESLQSQTYFEVKSGKRLPDYIDYRLKPILDKTYGAMLYQEQTIEICKQIAGMNLVEADLVRKNLGKKLPEEMRKWEDRFIQGCINNEVHKDVASEIWGWVERTAGYSFNFSHAIGYSLLSYYTAYLKANYTAEFFCACLRSARYAQDTASEIKKFVHDARLFGVEVIPPKATKGNIDFDIVDDGRIAFGLSSLKGVGEKAIDGVKLSSAKASSYDDFLFRARDNKINRRVMEAMIYSGALDEFEKPRIQMMARYELLSALTDNEIALLGIRDQDWIITVRQFSSEDTCLEFKTKERRIPTSRRRETIRKLLFGFDAIDMYDREIDRVGWEQHYLGISLTASLTSIFSTQNRCSDVVAFGGSNTPVELAVVVAKIKEHRTRKGDEMCFMTAGDESYELDNFVIFPQSYERFKALLKAGNILRVRGNVNDRGSVVVTYVEKIR